MPISQKFKYQFSEFDLDALGKDIEGGMYFDSSIPQGYGVGSSGALVHLFMIVMQVEKITVLENLTRDKAIKVKRNFS